MATNNKTIVKADVIGKRIAFDNGIAWEVDGVKYKYGYAWSKSTTGKFVDVLHAPVGYEMKGNIEIVRRTTFSGDRKETWTETVFQPHEGQVTDEQSAKWNKDHWIKCFGNDEHYYNDVEFVTYKDPATGKERTDKCYGISIQKEINVIVYRSNKGMPTMSIPIKNVIKRHLFNQTKS